MNDFLFGNEVMTKMIKQLADSGIEIIECGFLIPNETNADKSLFSDVNDLSLVIKEKSSDTLYVVMLQAEKFPIESLRSYDGKTVDGIRLSFHKSEQEIALKIAKDIKDKGYKLFIQTVGTTTYSDLELLKLIEEMNLIEPYAFYIVDTLGTMYKKELMCKFYLADRNLAPNIKLGFHAHNNLQQAFANAQNVLLANSSRDIIIDSSVLGMGRGAGNLCTELIVGYLNENFSTKYDLDCLLKIIDEFINPIRRRYEWGYSSTYYLTSLVKCHPNYAIKLVNRKNLSSRELYQILKSLDKEHRMVFDEHCLQVAYENYLHGKFDKLC